MVRSDFAKKLHEEVVQILPEWTVSGGGVTVEVDGLRNLHEVLSQRQLIPTQHASNLKQSRKWVHQVNWFISNTFDLPTILGRVWTVQLKGIESEMTVAINGRRLAQVDGDKQIHHLDVTNALRSGQNVIVCRLHSLDSDENMMVPEAKLIGAPKLDLAS